MNALTFICLLLSCRKHPFEYEQRAFHFLLGTPQWASRGLRKYQYQGLGQGHDGPVPADSPLHDAALSEAYIRSHFRIFPQVDPRRSIPLSLYLACH